MPFVYDSQVEYGTDPTRSRLPRFMAREPGMPSVVPPDPIASSVQDEVVNYKGEPPNNIAKAPGFLQSLFTKIRGMDPSMRAGLLGAISTKLDRHGNFLQGLTEGVGGYMQGERRSRMDEATNQKAMLLMGLQQRSAEAREKTAGASQQRADTYEKWVEKQPTFDQRLQLKNAGGRADADKLRAYMGYSPDEKRAFHEMRGHRGNTKADQEERAVKALQQYAFQQSGAEMTESEARILSRVKPLRIGTTTALEKYKDPTSGRMLPRMVSRSNFQVPGVAREIMKRYGLKDEDLYAISEQAKYETPESEYSSPVDADSTGAGVEDFDSSSGIQPPQDEEEVMATNDYETLYEWAGMQLSDEQRDWVENRLLMLANDFNEGQ